MLNVCGFGLEFYHPKGKSTKANKKSKNTISYIPKPPRVKPVTERVHTKKDASTCDSGFLIGRLTAGDACKSHVGSQVCLSMVKRHKNATAINRRNKRKAAATAHRKKMRGSVPRRHRKKWTLRSRGKYRNKNKKSKRAIRRQKAKKKEAAKKKKINDAKHMANRLLGKKLFNVKPLYPGSVHKFARQLAHRQLNKKKAQKKNKSSYRKHSKYCVRAVSNNLSYCCQFKNRRSAQSFANTQPDPEKFQDHLFNGAMAEKMDKSRKASKIIKKSTNHFLRLTGVLPPLKKSQGKE